MLSSQHEGKDLIQNQKNRESYKCRQSPEDVEKKKKKLIKVIDFLFFFKYGVSRKSIFFHG